MYHAIVRSKVRRAFAQGNAGRRNDVMAAFSPRIDHVFFGDHALGGPRSSPGRIHGWYERLARVFPDLEFELRRVDVVGWPWDTTVTVEWIDRFKLGDAVESNQGVHVLRFRWGRVVGLRVYCDTEKLKRVLARKVELG